MFTNKRFEHVLPVLTGDWNKDGPKLLRILNEYFLSLEQPDALAINEAEITASNGIAFPSTQNPSTDANTLDDYEEGSGALTIAASAGTLTTASATWRYTKVGNRVLYDVTATITTNGTGSGLIVITGMPFLPAGLSVGAARMNGNIGCVATAFNNAGTAQINVAKYDGTYPGASGEVIRITGHYDV
jgi:hypothetical protein